MSSISSDIFESPCIKLASIAAVVPEHAWRSPEETEERQREGGAFTALASLPPTTTPAPPLNMAQADMASFHARVYEVPAIPPDAYEVALPKA